MIFDRLAIGTANWGKEYNGVKVPEDEQKRILDYCREVGIDMLDTATAYEWDWTKISSYFKVNLKIHTKDELPEDLNQVFPMGHSMEAYLSIGSQAGKTIRGNYAGVSIYEKSEAIGLMRFRLPSRIQVSYSLFDRRFEQYFGEWKANDIEIHVRSVFLRGKILKAEAYFPENKIRPWQCIAFCLMNPYVDRVIIGVDSLNQLHQDIEPLRWLSSLEKTDEKILDPRKWKD